MFLSHISFAFSGCLPSLENIGDEVGIQVWNIKAPVSSTLYKLKEKKNSPTIYYYM